MSPPYAKLTRRRGACEACRQRKDQLVISYQRSETQCEYKIRPLRHRAQGTDIQSPGENTSTAGQLYVSSSDTMYNPLGLDSSTDNVISQATGILGYSLPTPASEGYFSQLVGDTWYSSQNLPLLEEMTPDISQAEPTELGEQIQSFQDQMQTHTLINDTLTLEWLASNSDQNLDYHIVTQRPDSLQTRLDSTIADCTLALLSQRISAETGVAKPFLNHRIHGITALFRYTDQMSHRKQAVLAKIKALLSSENHTCISNLLHNTHFSEEHQGLNLNTLPIKRLIQKAFQDIGSLSLFINEQDIMPIQERLFDPERPSIDVSDMSLLLTSLAWGALLDSEVALGTKSALLDALCLFERVGSENLPAVTLASVSTVASLGLHLESALHSSCVSDEQVIQSKRAMWMLYCIDKSYALRWNTFSLVDSASLPALEISNKTLQSDDSTVTSLRWLLVRLQYSRICSKILQLRIGADGEPSKDRLDIALALSAKLDEWYRLAETNQMMLLLDTSDASRLKLQVSYYYYEAQFQLASVYPRGPEPSLPLGPGQRIGSLRSSIKAIILSSSTLSLEDVFQNCNHLFMHILALCFLGLEILMVSDQESQRENQTLLSISVSLFARVSIELPHSSFFGAISNLANMLTDHHVYSE
ncbi:hypothetical protein COCMIDRAFT_110948 [Bipolaris oryzae ATCC 44560]|uniref:Transcription factor domain-containing protein n=1 Tax=Bipolaris oryzae ATCC 44560 TaxID=930090 RepID=W6YVV4_COCMI|nr:uncharacterized protein COCMIDRAFT_110948 [Bipolaris oryzae ATCC 44560]EUC39654.1 hypothetical protein COCMIDRAFT_110948 [Bipolaris oryzae ATCC 44560]